RTDRLPPHGGLTPLPPRSGTARPTSRHPYPRRRTLPATAPTGEVTPRHDRFAAGTVKSPSRGRIVTGRVCRGRERQVGVHERTEQEHPSEVHVHPDRGGQGPADRGQGDRPGRRDREGRRHAGR